MCLADGVMVCAFVLCRLPLVLVLVLACVFCWLAPLSAVGVRMARTGFSAIDIYLYTDGVARDCNAFSCACVGVLVVCAIWMNARFVSCLCGGVYMYLCINVLVACVVAWCWRSVRAYMDRYI